MEPPASWSPEETRALIDVWSEENIRRDLEAALRNDSVYLEMSNRLAALGISRSAEQCGAQIKLLKQEYGGFKLERDSGEVAGKPDDAGTSDRHAEDTTKQADTVVLELMGSDVETDTPTPKTFASSFPRLCTTENSQGPDLYSVKLEECDVPTTSTIVTSSAVQTAVMLSQGRAGRRREKRTCSWSKTEVHALLAYWANPSIQQELRRNVRNSVVYRVLSAKLASHGFNKTPQKCKEKIKKLKQDYRRIKNGQNMGVNRTAWFDIIDEVLGSQPPTSRHSETAESSSAECSQSLVLDMDADDSSLTTNITDSCSMPDQTLLPTNNQRESDFYLVKLVDSDAPSTSSAAASAETEAEAPLLFSPSYLGRRKCVHTCSWSKKEVHALLAHWANPDIQQELRRNVRNKVVYNCLSAKLAMLGFDKTPQKCKEKIKKLKQDYRRIKSNQQTGVSRTAWFEIMDEVLSSQPAASTCSETAESSSTDCNQSFMLDLETDDICADETFWLPDEVQVLVTLWAQPNIQKQLLISETNSQVFSYLSNELALVGFYKTPQQCCLKVNKLKEEYETIRHTQLHGVDKGDWFSIMERVLCPDGEPSKEVDSSSAPTAPKSPEDATQAVWTSDEVIVLLTRWAEESTQEQLRSAQEDERVYARLSSDLATQGFDKTTSQCRVKINLLKQEYKRVQEQEDSKEQKSKWFLIMDKVSGHNKPEVEAELPEESDSVSLEASQQDPPELVKGCRLSVSSLCLLVPTLRLMCAFAWQVVQCCNVSHYRKVEELVKLVTELAPELLTHRERVQLLLRLRARLVLELCRSENTADLLNVQPHLRIIQDLTISSGSDQKELEELENSKSNFVEVIHTLLGDSEQKKRFFKEVFPIHYGQQYEVTLKTLVWKFISRLDNLLPIPDIKQTAEWLSTAPSVMEECGRLVLQPEQLKTLLHFHAEQSRYANNCSYQAQNMFLPTLSLHPRENSELLVSEQQKGTALNEGQFDLSTDAGPFEVDQMDDELTPEDFVARNNDWKDGQSDDMITTNGLSFGPVPSRRHHCSMCLYSDSQVSGLLKHIRQEHLVQESSPFEDFNQDGFPQNDNPQTNFTESRGTADTSEYLLKDAVDIPGPPYHCNKCDKKYLSRASLIVHYRNHTGETPYLCPHCGQGFRASSNLELHLRIHTGERPYKCHICGKTSIQHLTRHMRMHRGEKNYLCTECGKTFLSSGELKLHMRYHTGERPYKCKHCGKGFIAKCHLTVHVRQHTGESPYRCPLCPKAFPTLRAQKKHLKIHSSKKSFQCLKCGKIFRQEDTFKLHVETHDFI